jgi:hypothetical protein
MTSSSSSPILLVEERVRRAGRDEAAEAVEKVDGSDASVGHNEGEERLKCHRRSPREERCLPGTRTPILLMT